VRVRHKNGSRFFCLPQDLYLIKCGNRFTRIIISPSMCFQRPWYLLYLGQVCKQHLKSVIACCCGGGRGNGSCILRHY
jgi:hypothetical protein